MLQRKSSAFNQESTRIQTVDFIPHLAGERWRILCQSRPPPPPRPPPPVCLPCRSSTASSHVQCSLPDLNRESSVPCQTPTRTATSDVPCRTSTASSQVRTSTANLSPLFPATPQPRPYALTVGPQSPCCLPSTSKHMSQSKECQKVCQKCRLSENVSERMSERM